MQAEFERQYADRRVVICTCGELFIAVWTDAPTIVQMDAFEQHGRAYEQALGRGVLLSNLAVSGTPKFDDSVRRKAAELTADPGLFALARAHTILMDGFKGTAVRAFVQTFLLLGRPPHPTKVFSSVPAAAPWMCTQLSRSPLTWTADAIVEAHAQARRSAEAYVGD